MNELLNHPLLKPENIWKVINDVEVSAAQYRGMEILPMTTTDDEEIIVDVKKLHGGMTQAVAKGAESPVIQRRGARQFRFTPGNFREKMILSPRDLATLRKLGTIGEKETAAATIADVAMTLRARVETRIEWARWQAIQGSIAIDENEVIYEVDYNFPTANTPVLTGTDRWDQASTSDPINDIMDWIFLFRGTGVMMKKLWFNSEIERLLFQNDRIIALMNNIVSSGNATLMTRATLQNFFRSFIGNVEYEVYDEGYWVTAVLRTAVTAGATSLVVDSVYGLSSGQTVTITAFDGEPTEEVTIDNFSNNTIVLTSGTTNGYSVGAEIRVWRPFIPDDKVVVEGMMPRGSLGGDNIGEFISTRSPYGAGNLMNMRPGVFAETQFHENMDPKHVAVIGGVYGLPVLYRNNGFIIATVT